MSLAAAALLLLGACANMDFDAVKNMETKGTAFQKELHNQYVRLAKLEVDEFDWNDAAFFNERARRAASGQNFGPQEISERNEPAEALPLLEASRERLMDAFSEGMDAFKPVPAARAQAAFDCWLQEQEENFQPDDIAACRDDFMAALRELRAVKQKAEAPKPMPEKPMMAKPALAAGPYIVQFGFDSASLTAEARTIIRNAADAAKVGEATTVLVTGHTDRSGKPDYNMELSERRTAAVFGGLLDNGVDPAIVKRDSLGETKPAVATADGKREARNRRVEILLQR